MTEPQDPGSSRRRTSPACGSRFASAAMARAAAESSATTPASGARGDLPARGRPASPTARKPAVRGVSFDIGKNEITALIGPSGCGKSTLIRCLNRMNDLIPGARVEGKVLYHGQDLYGSQVDAGRGAQADRDGLPEAEPVPEVDLRQHRLRPARARDEGQHGRDRRARARAGARSGTRSRTGSRPTPSACPAASSSGSASRAASRSTPT